MESGLETSLLFHLFSSYVQQPLFKGNLTLLMETQKQVFDTVPKPFYIHIAIGDGGRFEILDFPVVASENDLATRCARSPVKRFPET